MKTHTVGMAILAAAAVMMAGSAFAGQTQAEREMSRRYAVDPENALGWQIRPAQETGGLPSEGDSLTRGTGVKEALPTVEIGGRVYRIGIDNL